MLVPMGKSYYVKLTWNLKTLLLLLQKLWPQFSQSMWDFKFTVAKSKCFCRRKGICHNIHKEYDRLFFKYYNTKLIVYKIVVKTSGSRPEGLFSANWNYGHMKYERPWSISYRQGKKVHLDAHAWGITMALLDICNNELRVKIKVERAKIRYNFIITQSRGSKISI